MIKVLIVEDQKMALNSIVRYIEESKDYTLVGTLANAATTELFCRNHEVDLILMDVCTQYDENGIEAAAAIKKYFPQIKIIIITSMPECSFINKAREADADSFWYKDGSAKELLDVMNRTMNNISVYPDKTPEVRLGFISSYNLTATELKVLRALMENTTYREVAKKLGCSERTVRFHLTNILNKTGYRTRFELCMAVAQKKLIITNHDKRFM